MKFFKIIYIIYVVKTKERNEVKMATRDKNIWVLLIFILSGLVIGGLLGDLASRIDWLWWLGFGEEFGLDSPLIKITFALTVRINIASILGMGIALFVYRKV